VACQESACAEGSLNDIGCLCSPAKRRGQRARSQEPERREVEIPGVPDQGDSPETEIKSSELLRNFGSHPAENQEVAHAPRKFEGLCQGLTIRGRPRVFGIARLEGRIPELDLAG